MSSEEDLVRLLEAEANRYRPTDGREGVLRRVRSRRRARRSAAGMIGVVVLAVAIVVPLASRGTRSSMRVTVISPHLTVPAAAAQQVVALTTSGALVELSPSGELLRQVASPEQVLRCYGTTPGCVAPKVSPNAPLTQAAVAYDATTQTALVNLGLSGQIVGYPLNGSRAPYLIGEGDEPTVTANGESLAYTGAEAEHAKSTVTVQDLATAKQRSWTISAVTVADDAGLPDASTAEDTSVAGLSWAPDNRHLAVTLAISFGLNAANSLGTTFFEVVDLDTAAPVSATNPRLVGPSASSMSDLRSPSNGKGWADATWLGATGRLVALDAQTGDLNGSPVRLETIEAATGAVIATSTLDQPTIVPSRQTPQIQQGGAVLGADANGDAVLLLGDGPPRLEIWDPGSGSTLHVVAQNVAAATWGAPTNPAVTYGTISGTLQAVGGPAPGSPRPLPGTVTIRSEDGKTTTVTVGTDGVFTAQIPAGSYQIAGRSPLYEGGAVTCATVPSPTVQIPAGATTKVNLDCEEK